MSIIIECKEYYQEVMKFAEANNCADQLTCKLERLTSMARFPEQVFLHKDFAPLSFAFVICENTSTRGLVGGLIYSGPHQTLDGSAPTFTVSVEPPSNEHKWSIHT